MTEHSNYEKNLKKWEKELQRQKEEFTIVETDLDADKRLYVDPEVRPLPCNFLRCVVVTEGKMLSWHALHDIYASD